MKKLIGFVTIALLAAGVSFAQGIQDDIDKSNNPRANPAPRTERQRELQQRTPQQEQRTPQQQREFQRPQQNIQPRGQFGLCECCKLYQRQQYMQRQHAPNRYYKPRHFNAPNNRVPQHKFNDPQKRGERRGNTRNQQAE